MRDIYEGKWESDMKGNERAIWREMRGREIWGEMKKIWGEIEDRYEEKWEREREMKGNEREIWGEIREIWGEMEERYEGKWERDIRGKERMKDKKIGRKNEKGRKKEEKKRHLFENNWQLTKERIGMF